MFQIDSPLVNLGASTPSVDWGSPFVFARVAANWKAEGPLPVRSHGTAQAGGGQQCSGSCRWRVPGFWQCNFMNCVAGQPLFV